MSTVVNHNNRLYTRIKENLRGYDEYRLVEDAPSLKYSRVIDSRLAISIEDGRLYDTHNRKYLDLDVSNFSEVILTNSFNTQRGQTFLALSGTSLYGGYLDKNGNVSDWKLRDGEYRTILRLVIGNDEPIDDGNIGVVSPGMIRLSQGIVIYIDEMSDPISIRGTLIGCGFVDKNAIVIERIEERLTLTIHSIDNNSLYSLFGYRPQQREVYNKFLDDMDILSSFIGVISINDQPCLINKEGVAVILKGNCDINSVKIPPYLLIIH